MCLFSCVSYFDDDALFVGFSQEYDKEVKGFVFVLEGSGQTNKMQLPKETKQTRKCKSIIKCHKTYQTV